MSNHLVSAAAAAETRDRYLTACAILKRGKERNGKPMTDKHRKEYEEVIAKIKRRADELSIDLSPGHLPGDNLEAGHARDLAELDDMLGVGNCLPSELRSAVADSSNERIFQLEADKQAFERWWADEGSGMPPHPGEDAEMHVHRITAIAWCNGAYLARVALQDELASTRDALAEKRRDCDVLMIRWRNEQEMRLAAEGKSTTGVPWIQFRATGGTDGEITA